MVNHVLFVFRVIKVWDFQAALDPRTPADALCLTTSVVSVASISTINSIIRRDMY